MEKLSKIFILPFLVFSFFNGFAQEPFEGEIEFVKKSGTETVKYIYHVKGNNVRIDELNSDNTLVGVMIVNTKTYEAISLNLERKMYIDLEKNNTKLAKIDGVETINGKGTKKIAGYNCKEVIVKNKTDKTQVTFYMVKDNFSFFEGLIIALNRKDKPALYFQQIPDIKNVFPFLAIEQDATGKEISRLEVLQAVKRKVEDDLFKIPEGYSKL